MLLFQEIFMQDLYLSIYAQHATYWKLTPKIHFSSKQCLCNTAQDLAKHMHNKLHNYTYTLTEWTYCVSSVESFVLEEDVWIGQVFAIVIVSLKDKVHRWLIQTITLREGEKGSIIIYYSTLSHTSLSLSLTHSPWPAQLWGLVLSMSVQLWVVLVP